MKHILLFLAFLPASGIAESVAPYSIDTRIRNIISAVGVNWNSSSSFKAVLIREDEYAALYIFRGPFDQAPLAYAPQAAITGDTWASVPWLEFDEDGTLHLHSENRAFGRNKWEATLSIIERNGKFIVSAFSLNAYDSLNPDRYTDCNIDMLTRTLIVNDSTITPYPLPAEVTIQNWNEEFEGECYVSNEP